LAITVAGWLLLTLQSGFPVKSLNNAGLKVDSLLESTNCCDHLRIFCI